MPKLTDEEAQEIESSALFIYSPPCVSGFRFAIYGGTLARAFELNPNRFVQGVAIPKRPQPVVWINRPKNSTSTVAPGSTQPAVSTPHPAQISRLAGHPESALFDSLPKLLPSVSHAC